MAQQPDLIVLGGDYVTWTDRRYMEPAADALAPLAAPHGVFAVLGNHDDDREMPAALRGPALHRPARRSDQADDQGDVLDIAGLRFWTHRVPDVTRVLKGASSNTILLAHTPKRLAEAAALSVPLMLSGHTHGGQIDPGLGAIAA